MRLLYLVRHAQASFGKRDYDALSDLGHEQSRVLGRALADRQIVPDVVIRGELRRHRETADGILVGLADADADAAASVPVEVDAGWDEFDFQHVVEVHKPLYRSRTVMLADLARSRTPRQRFQEIFEDATARWTGGESDDDYRESFPAFTDRIQAALLAAAARTPDSGTAIVVTSGGPIGLAASHLLAGDASLWAPLNKVAVNTAVTKVINGRSGLTLSSYNDHSHVEHDRRLLTYR
ncbi:histidine phosphatase family protein [Nocardioides sp. HM23]|uniref:histidine phosphatase family protein n=1 Tax=Nocardioides bizhenqiangii TaxID=3095076 RepID=UPI002ACAD043|nr:histidine phosphatase family protein [Nocardioides sp. HM23]MDZ5623354.1 histidine phosphatase family protein [Nocardioides sp. HM23]